MIFCVMKMGKHRDRLAILANILSVVSDNSGAKKTHIMYQAYLSYKLLVQYLNDVTEAGLVKYTENNCYELTAKGQKFLDSYHDYCKTNKSIEKQLNEAVTKKKFLEKLYLED